MAYEISPARSEERSFAYRLVTDLDDCVDACGVVDPETRFLVARREGSICGAVAIEPRAPGLASIVIPTATAAEPSLRKALLEAASNFMAAKPHTSVVLMIEPDDVSAAQAALQLGFIRGCEIAFMERAVGAATGASDKVEERVEFVDSFEAQLLPILRMTLQRSLDCPMLQDAVGPEEMLAGFACRTPVGLRHWQVARVGPDDAGCLLLGRLAGGAEIELVYMGVAPQFRGLGLGRALVVKALNFARQHSCERITLAVDEANLPAMRIYWALEFRSFGQRVMWFKSR